MSQTGNDSIFVTILGWPYREADPQTALDVLVMWLLLLLYKIRRLAWIDEIVVAYFYAKRAILRQFNSLYIENIIYFQKFAII